MRVTVSAGMVHGEPTTTTTRAIDEHELIEHGWEVCGDTIDAAIAEAKRLMHPEEATWVTVEWTWKPL